MEGPLSTDSRTAFVIPPSGWLLIAVLMVCGARDLGFWDGIAGAAMVIFCLIIHEAAHVFAASFFNVRVHETGIKFIGAYTRRQPAACRSHEIAISAAGPLASVFLFIVLFFVPRIGPWLSAWNLGIAVFNLLPFSGTDGYRILKTIWLPAKTADVLRLQP